MSYLTKQLASGKPNSISLKKKQKKTTTWLFYSAKQIMGSGD